MAGMMAKLEDHPRNEQVTIVDLLDRPRGYALRADVNADPAFPIRRVSMVFVRDSASRQWIGQIPNKGPLKGWPMPGFTEHVQKDERYRSAAQAGFAEEVWYGRPSPFKDKTLADERLWYSGARALIDIYDYAKRNEQRGRAMIAFYVLFLPPTTSYEQLSLNPSEVERLVFMKTVDKLAQSPFFDMQSARRGRELQQLEAVFARLSALEDDLPSELIGSDDADLVRELGYLPRYPEPEQQGNYCFNAEPPSISDVRGPDKRYF